MASIPTVYIWKDGNRMRVNYFDAPAWVERGWSLTDASVAPAEVAKVVDPAPIVEPVTPEKPFVGRRGKAKAG